LVLSASKYSFSDLNDPVLIKLLLLLPKIVAQRSKFQKEYLHNIIQLFVPGASSKDSLDLDALHGIVKEFVLFRFACSCGVLPDNMAISARRVLSSSKSSIC
jgi:hypothetical protein